MLPEKLTKCLNYIYIYNVRSHDAQPVHQCNLGQDLIKIPSVNTFIYPSLMKTCY